MVERPVEIPGRGGLLVGQPENAEGAAVRQGGAGPRLKDVLRREHDAGDREALAAAVEEQGEGGAGCQPVRLGERLAHEQLAPRAGRQPAAAAQKEPVELGLAEIRQRAHDAAGGLGEAGQVKRDGHGEIGLDGGHARKRAEAFPQLVGRALERPKDLGEMMPLVILGPGTLE